MAFPLRLCPRIARAIAAAALTGACIATSRGAGAASVGRDPTRIPLVDQDGARFTFHMLTGRPLVVTFIATRCTDTCPIADAAFFGLQRKMQRAHLNAMLLTITLDPAYDRPIVMSRFARAFGADPDRWRFASGSIPNVRALMRSFGVVAHADAHGVPDVHSTFAYVIDARGRLTKTMLLSTNFADEALSELRRETTASSPAKKRGTGVAA